MRIASAVLPSASSTPILSATLAPPSTATNGRAGSSRSEPSSSSSRSMSSPAYAGSRCATPSVEACARCAEPNASFTYRSPCSASSAANDGSFSVSRGSKRVFSRSRQRSSGSSSRTRGSTSDSESAGSSPFGRPRCEQRTSSVAPRSSRSSSVGSAARIRVSSATLPSSSGTLKSTRTRTRFPATSASRTDLGRCIRGAAGRDPRAGTNSPTRCRTRRTPSPRGPSPS